MVQLVYAQSNTIKGHNAAELVEQLSKHVVADYLYPERAEKIKVSLTKYKNRLKKNQIVEIAQFTDDVNTLLFDATGDHHLKFYYDPEKFEVFQNKNQAIIDSLEREQFRKINFGVQKVENLTNNIGLLRLNKFQNFDDAKEVLQGAAMLLANSDAVIIDLRINRGGDGKTKEYLEAFFLTEQQFFNRETEFFDTTEFRKIKKACLSCQRLEKVPLYILTGNGTFSAAEGFCYDLQKLERAQIIGTKTKGGGHSGSSVALSKGFLVFIPIGGKKSPIEGVGIIPNQETREDLALLTAQKGIIDAFMANCTDSVLLQQYEWSSQTINAFLLQQNLNLKALETYVGDYSYGFAIQLIGDNLFLVNQEKNTKSELIAINESYFIAKDNVDFGEGNFRLQFMEGNKVKLLVNLGVEVAEMILEKKE